MLHGDPALPSLKKHNPNFDPYLLWPNVRPFHQLLNSCVLLCWCCSCWHFDILTYNICYYDALWNRTCLIFSFCNFCLLSLFHTRCGLCANLDCGSGMCCTWLAANIGHKRRHIFCTIAQFCRVMSSHLRHVLSSDTSFTCPHNMVNFGLLLHLGHASKFYEFCFGVSRILGYWTVSATYIRQGGHHLGHWPTFLLIQFRTWIALGR